MARNRELAEFDHLLRRGRRGRAGVVGLHGECGVGKSALVEAAVAHAADFKIVQVRGASMSGTAEIRDVVSTWPGPLHELATRVGAPERARPGPPTDIAAHAPVISSELVDAAATSLRGLLTASPLLVAVDDCHVLPEGLVVALAAAVTGPLREEPISLVLAWRDTPHVGRFRLGLREASVHELGGLTLPQGRELLSSHCEHVPEDPVLVELIGRTGGNPLALLDACDQLTAAQLSGWHPLPDPLPLGSVALEAFDVARDLPPATRRAIAVVAAGNAPTDAVAQAMDRLGVSMGDLAPALDAGIVYRLGPRIGFRHPLVRGAAFHRVAPEERQEIRRVLSDVLADASAVEASAYHASLGPIGIDALAVRRLAEAASVAEDRGDPGAAARYGELAAGAAAVPDEAAEHLVDAAINWAASGAADRARYCLDAAATLEPGACVMAEVSYRRARLTRSADEVTVPEQMVAAAEACANDQPKQALVMLLDAAAWRVLTDQPAEAQSVAQRAVRLAGAVSSPFELLARMVHSAALDAGGKEVESLGYRSRTPLLIGDLDRFPCSPEVAFVIGRSLLRQGLRRQAQRWSQWIASCAERCGDVSMAAVPLLLDCSLALVEGDLVSAASALEAIVVSPEAAGSLIMSARAWQLAALVHAMAGDYERGFAAALRLFSVPNGVVGAARLRALPALAFLELQRGHLDSAMAWARTGIAELGVIGGPRPMDPTTFCVVASLLSSVPVLAGSPGDLHHSGVPIGAELLEPCPEWCRAWLEGVCEAEDPMKAVGLLDAAAGELADRPLLQLVVELCSSARLSDAGCAELASDRLATAEQRALERGAAGLARIAGRKRRAILEASGVGSLGPRVTRDVSFPASSEKLSLGLDVTSGVLAPEWEISVLGGFSVRRRGKPLSLPASLATQAIKIVAVQGRLTVDEIIEYLWEEAEPRVGTRRLRNVLWRIRSMCGDLLVRSDGFLCLAPTATTDLERFDQLAGQALEAGGTGTVEAARAAIDFYRGELLPGDRYADWSVAARESTTRTYLRLLDVLVDDAVAGERQVEALVLLDRLASADPYEERHHLRTAQIHLDAGNRGRALDALEHAERVLADLGVAPSPAARQLRASIDNS